jgi:lipopolysaccharide transport system ATP-binding protein
MSAVIKVEELSKKFIIGHEEKEKYTSLRDVMARNAKKIFSFPFKIKNTSTTYKKEAFWALQDVSFTIEQGDRVGIIGRNGAGKSTLLKVLSRITDPSSGRISIKGRIASLLEVGTGFHPELSGRENIYLNGAILGMTRNEIRQKFDEIVAFAEVEQFLDTPVKRYSSGMYVRLAFAVAAHLEPEILIVDEVLAVGDAEFQKKCLGKMEDVSSKEGRTIIFVSHHMAAIKSLCSSILYLKQGRVIERGSVDSTIRKYFEESRVNNEDGHIDKSYPRKYTNGMAFFSKITVSKKDGTRLSEFAYGEPIKVLAELDVETNLEPCLINILIVSSGGEHIAFCGDSSAGRYEPKSFTKGKHLVEVDINIKLLPNNYSISALIAFHSNGTPVDWVETVCSFSVSAVGTQTGADYPWGVVHGFVEPDSNWKYNFVG